MSSAPRNVKTPEWPCTIDEAIAYLEALRVERPLVMIGRVSVSDQRPDYLALRAAVQERQPFRGTLPGVVMELFPDIDERAARNLANGARRAGYIHNRGSRNQPAWFASDR